MGKRLNQERQAELEPQRMEYAIRKIKELGYTVYKDNPRQISFLFKQQLVTYWPYSGWATGKSIKDGRGIDHLLKQIR